mmetsp:Transcript_24600/g.82782  ORF Transcript_24600/g.82782 Transcript_24600/m.82782 type:complete len:223 (-) Transcript_24600:259-927(-)
MPAVAKAQTMMEKLRGEKVSNFVTAASASSANKDGAATSAVAKARAVLANAFELKFFIFLRDSAAIALYRTKTFSLKPANAKACARMESSADRNVFIFSNASRDKAWNTSLCSTRAPRTVENAHAVLATSFEVKSSAFAITSSSKALNSTGAETPAFPKAQAVLASWVGENVESFRGACFVVPSSSGMSLRSASLAASLPTGFAMTLRRTSACTALKRSWAG